MDRVRDRARPLTGQKKETGLARQGIGPKAETGTVQKSETWIG